MSALGWWWWWVCMFSVGVGPPCLKTDFLPWMLGQLTQSTWLTSLKSDQRVCCSSCAKQSDHLPLCYFQDASCTKHASSSSLDFSVSVSDLRCSTFNTLLLFYYSWQKFDLVISHRTKIFVHPERGIPPEVSSNHPVQGFFWKFFLV